MTQQGKAKYDVRDAIRYGRMVVPVVCSKCSSNPGKGVDGQRLLQAHHKDHAKTLEVEWLCVKCHREITPTPKGERNCNAFLSDKQVEELKAYYKVVKSCRKTGRKFGINATNVSRIVTGKSRLVTTGKAEV